MTAFKFKSQPFTPVQAANSRDTARNVERALSGYETRLGEPDVDEEMVRKAARGLELAQLEALYTASNAEGSLLVASDGSMTVAEATGKGRRSGANGVRDEKDAAYRLLALIFGNPTGSQLPRKVYAGLKRYDEKAGPVRTEETVSEDTINTFASMTRWTDDEWEAFEKGLEVRMTGVEAYDQAGDLKCGDCRRSRALAQRKGWVVKACRPCQRGEREALDAEQAAERLAADVDRVA